MKVYIGHSNDFNFKEELYMTIMNLKLNEKNEFIFPHLTDKTFNSKEVIEQSDLLQKFLDHHWVWELKLVEQK